MDYIKRQISKTNFLSISSVSIIDNPPIILKIIIIIIIIIIYKYIGQAENSELLRWY